MIQETYSEYFLDYNESERNTRTKSKIRRAFKKLLNTTSYEQISVKEICEQAGIIRNTFYTYYDSKNDLLTSVLDCTLRFLFVNEKEAAAINSSENKYREYLRIVFRKVMAHREELLLLSERKALFQIELYGSWTTRFRNMLSSMPTHTLIPIDLQIELVISNTFCLMRWLISHPEETEEDAERYIDILSSTDYYSLFESVFNE